MEGLRWGKWGERGPHYNQLFSYWGGTASWERDFDSGKPKDKTSEKQQEEYSSRGNSKSPEATEECQRRRPGKEGTIRSESERKARGEGIPARRVKVDKGTRV